MGVYVLDSNFFIQAQRINYPLDVVPSFWNKVLELANRGVLISIDKVKEELYGNNDELESWCRANLPQSFFKDTSVIMDSYSQVVKWTNSKRNHYLQKAIDEFLESDRADAFLVAYALADSQNRIIVTHEKSQPEKKSQIKIPEPCNELGIYYKNTIEMFRNLRESF